MIKFSPKNQTFYDLELKYPDLPEDLIEVTSEQHYELLGKINLGCIIFADLTASPPRPDKFHMWNGTAWIDQRTDAEKRAAYLASVPPLTKRQFNLYLYDAGLKDEVDALLATNPRAKVEFDSTDKVIRTSPTVEVMIALLDWTDEQVDQMWQQALTL
ncbi:hypothetical protein [Acinetobacter sp. YH1901141]|uniref:hypothetical protein n=1 Tax=Acinetobacter sp. YH1901141 TaxID=2601201 RepID=UPI0015D2E6FA|nr:hypothetical protein [Acinetobacter sp. YH1901141]